VDERKKREREYFFRNREGLNLKLWTIQFNLFNRGAPDRLFYYPAGAGFGRIVKYDIRPEPDNVNLSSYII
jgi:hypothetical protein